MKRRAAFKVERMLGPDELAGFTAFTRHPGVTTDEGKAWLRERGHSNVSRAAVHRFIQRVRGIGADPNLPVIWQVIHKLESTAAELRRIVPEPHGYNAEASERAA